MSSYSLDLLWMLTAAVAAGAVLCFAYGIRAWAAGVHVGTRLELFVHGAELASPTARPPSFRVRAVMPFVQTLAQIANGLLPDRQVERTRSNLAIAGMRTSRHLAQFLATQLALAIAVGALATLYSSRIHAPAPQIVLLGFIGVVFGYYLPIVWLGRRMSQRKAAVLKALPDALDLLSISVSAGLGFDGALIEVVQRWNNPLTEEFTQVQSEMNLGSSRRDALRAFARRTAVDEVTSFVAAVIQAYELGAPMKEILVIQAEQVRMHRRHKAEETARKATVKMLIPMVFCIFPAMFIVLLGPAVPSLRVLSQLSH